jgi:uncharacterized protein
MLHYVDSVHGEVLLEEPVLEELIRSRAVQRLTKVLQHGITGLLGITRPITRFEHSVGVMLLVRSLQGSVPEQIAALLHDVSHTAFSHVIDHVFSTPTGQSYHEQVKKEYMAASDLPAILHRYGYNWEVFLPDEPYTLLEQPSPALCADRLDYVLRDGMALGLITPQEARWVLSQVSVVAGRLVMDEPTAARWLADTFMETDHRLWSNPQAVGLYELTARAIATGLQLGVITPDDIWTSDQELWDKLQPHPDQDLQRLLKAIHPATRVALDAQQADFWITPKIRTIDPAVRAGQQTIILSQIDSDYAQRRLTYLNRKQKVWPLRIIRPDGQN